MSQNPFEGPSQASTPPGSGEGPAYPAAPAPPQIVVRRPARRPAVTYALLGITILVYLAQVASQSFFNGMDLPALAGLKVNELIARGEFWRLITPVFLHGSIYHILFNMYALYIFGPGLERHYGHVRFLALYLLGGFAGNVASFVFSPSASLGSSTAIFGLLGAEGVFLYINRRFFPGMARRALSQIVTIAVINLVIGLSPGIDNWGHIGGLVGGTLFAWFGGPLLRAESGPLGLAIEDGREARQAWVAGLGVAALFGLLTALGMIRWGG